MYTAESDSAVSMTLVTVESMTPRCQRHCWWSWLRGVKDTADGGEHDSAVSKTLLTVQSMTLRCQWHCWRWRAWLCGVKDMAEFFPLLISPRNARIQIRKYFNTWLKGPDGLNYEQVWDQKSSQIFLAVGNEYLRVIETVFENTLLPAPAGQAGVFHKNNWVVTILKQNRHVTRFFGIFLFHESKPPGPLINRLKWFCLKVRFRGEICEKFDSAQC